MPESPNPRLVVLFDFLGPYHLARLRAAARGGQLHAIEFSGRSGDYGWERSDSDEPFIRQTLFPQQDAQRILLPVIRARIAESLQAIRPDVVALTGWAQPASIEAMRWCLRNRVAMVMMSNSRAEDSARSRLKEALKRRIVSRARAGLVGGRPQHRYLASLGIAGTRIFTGYACVDNARFATAAEAVRADAESWRTRLGLPPRFLLIVARFIAKKRLGVALRSYAAYARGSAHPLPLVLAGDGPLRAELEAFVAEQNLRDRVYFHGFQQMETLPAYYALADAMILASRSEQWGLVVNEANACGLPAIVSDDCGCFEDLVQPPDGVPAGNLPLTDIRADDQPESAQLVAHLQTIERGGDDLQQRRDAVRRRIEGWAPERFCEGLWAAARAALDAGTARPTPWDDAVLRLAARSANRAED